MSFVCPRCGGPIADPSGTGSDMGQTWNPPVSASQSVPVLLRGSCEVMYTYDCAALRARFDAAQEELRVLREGTIEQQIAAVLGAAKCPMPGTVVQFRGEGHAVVCSVCIRLEKRPGGPLQTDISLSVFQDNGKRQGNVKLAEALALTVIEESEVPK